MSCQDRGGHMGHHHHHHQQYYILIIMRWLFSFSCFLRMQTKICENTEDRFTIHLLVKFKSEMLLTKKSSTERLLLWKSWAFKRLSPLSKRKRFLLWSDISTLLPLRQNVQLQPRFSLTTGESLVVLPRWLSHTRPCSSPLALFVQNLVVRCFCLDPRKWYRLSQTRPCSSPLTLCPSDWQLTPFRLRLGQVPRLYVCGAGASVHNLWQELCPDTSLWTQAEIWGELRDKMPLQNASLPPLGGGRPLPKPCLPWELGRGATRSTVHRHCPWMKASVSDVTRRSLWT